MLSVKSPFSVLLLIPYRSVYQPGNTVRCESATFVSTSTVLCCDQLTHTWFSPVARLSFPCQIVEMLTLVSF